MEFITLYNEDGTLVEKVVSEVFSVNKYLTIRLQSVLNKKSSKGKAQSRTFISEYNSGKYIDHSKLAYVKETREDYLVFSFFNTNTNKYEEILFTYHNLFEVKRLFKEASVWFEDEYIDDVFVTNKRGILVTNPNLELRTIASRLVQNNAMGIEPAVITIDSQSLPGVKLLYNDPNKFIYLTENEFMALEDFIQGFNLYMCSRAISTSARLFNLDL